MRRCGGSISSPLGALAVTLLLVCSLHQAAAAARVLLLHAVPPHGHRQENGAKAAAVDRMLVLQHGAEANGDGELSATEMMVGEEEEDASGVACGQGSDDECLQRRLLRDAHLDYIYTQDKGKP